jgi:hypothetical protein
MSGFDTGSGRRPTRLRLDTLDDRSLPSGNPFGPAELVANNGYGNGISSHVADFNGDGHPDLLVAGAYQSLLNWHANDGTGHFGPARAIDAPVQANSPGLREVTAADVDGDGDQDVLATYHVGTTSRVVWYQNDGGGGFGFNPAAPDAHERLIGSGSVPYSVRPADIDGDGTLDVAVAYRGMEPVVPGYTDNRIVWYANTQGDGSAWAGHEITTNPGGFTARPLDLDVADVDGDGRPDILAVGRADSYAHWYRNPGAGPAGPWARSVINPQDPIPMHSYGGGTSVLAADLDGDGDRDVVVGEGAGGRTVAWYRNDGAGQFARRQQIADTGGLPTRADVADVDGDGDLDLVQPVWGPYAGWANKVEWYENVAGDGSAWAVALVSTGQNAPGAATVADLNGDRRPDLTVSSLMDGKLVVHLSQLPEAVPPTADIVDVTPDPRADAVGPVTVVFSEPVTGVDVTDFVLTRNGRRVPLDGVPVSPDPSSDGSRYTLDLSSVTGPAGGYQLTLLGPESGIRDLAGNPLAGPADDPWTTVLRVERLSVTTPVPEGGTARLTVELDNPDPATAYPVSVDWGDGGPPQTALIPAGSSALELTHVYQDDAGPGAATDYTVRVQVDGAANQAAVVRVANVAPTIASFDLPTVAARGKDVTLRAQYTDPGVLDTHRAAIDWGDGTTEPVIAGGGVVTARHVYPAAGRYTVRLTVTDKDGGVTTVTRVVDVRAIYVGPGCAGPTTLVIAGTATGDIIRVAPQGPQTGGPTDRVTVLFNGKPQGTFTGFQGIAIYGLAGNDDLQLAGSIEHDACLVGGDGNDRLKAGGGTNVLLGGAGNDDLNGDAGGASLMIGGAGADRLVGAAGADVLIGGTTAFDSDCAALRALRAEWGSGADYRTRVNHLTGAAGGGLNGSYLLTPATVFDDGAVDRLTGSSAGDLFFARLSGPFADVVTDAKPDETVVRI